MVNALLSTPKGVWDLLQRIYRAVEVKKKKKGKKEEEKRQR